MPLAALVAVASALPEAQDPLDALFARAVATKCLRAKFELTRSASPEPVVYTLDYRAPDSMRLETRSEDGVTDMWFVGTALSLRSDQGGVTMAVDVDFAALHLELRDLEARAAPRRGAGVRRRVASEPGPGASGLPVLVGLRREGRQRLVPLRPRVARQAERVVALPRIRRSARRRRLRPARGSTHRIGVLPV